MKNLTDSLTNGYALLGSPFVEIHTIQPVKSPELVLFNTDLAEQLQIDPKDPSLLPLLAGNLEPNHATLVATAYAGHQFGHYSPRLGDGRACLLGEVTDIDGNKQDVQLKGSGVTAFARRGDGRSALGPALREFIISEAMNSLGIATTRSLGVVSTGEQVQRETMQPGGIVTRVAESHIRVGSFEYFHQHQDVAALKMLTYYAIQRHDADLVGSDTPYLSFLKRVLERQAHLIASWLQVGFVHGVMNTDNCAVSGQTIDFGPCAFMDRYRAQAVFSSIDAQGRYAFWNQAQIGLWNISRLAESLLPLIDEEVENGEDAAELVNSVLESYDRIFSDDYLLGMLKKLGLTQRDERDVEFVMALLTLLEQEAMDYTQFFRNLPEWLEDPIDHGSDQRHLDAFSDWIAVWKKRLEKEGRPHAEVVKQLNGVNPVYIPRNHIVEQALSNAVDQGDYDLIHELMSVLKSPYKHQAGKEWFAEPPKHEDLSYQTFCGT